MRTATICTGNAGDGGWRFRTRRYLLNRAGYHGRHVPHGFRAAFSTIMNEWATVHGRPDDGEVIDLMFANVPTNKVGGAYNRAVYMERRRDLTIIWAEMVSQNLLKPVDLLPLPVKASPWTSGSFDAATAIGRIT